MKKLASFIYYIAVILSGIIIIGTIILSTKEYLILDLSFGYDSDPIWIELHDKTFIIVAGILVSGSISIGGGILAKVLLCLDSIESHNSKISRNLDSLNQTNTQILQELKKLTINKDSNSEN